MARPSPSRIILPTVPPPPPRPPTFRPNPPPLSTSRSPPTSAAPRPTTAAPPPPPPPITTTTTKSSVIRTPPPVKTSSLGLGNARSVGDSGGDGIGGGAIAGMAVGVLAVLIGSIVGGFLLLKQRRKRLMHVGKNNRRNSGYPEFDPHRHSSSEHHNRRRYDRGDTGVGYGGGGYYYGDESLPSSSSRARRAESTIGIYDEKSFHAAKAGVGGPRLLPTSTGSTSSLDRDALGPGDRYSKYNNGRYVGTGHRTGGGGEGGYYPPFAPGAPGMLKDKPGDHRDSRTQSVVLDSQQLERERELDLQQQARMMSMADAENQLPPMSGAVLKNPPGGSYNQHSQCSQKQPPTQQYYYDDGYGNYGEYDGEYDGQYGEYDDGYYNAQWGPGPQDTAYGMVPNSQQPQNPYGSQNPYPKAEGYTQQQQQQGPSPSPRKSRDNVTAAWQDMGQAPLEQGPTIAAMSNASAVSGSESMVHSPTTAGTSPGDEVMPSMGTDFVMNRQELLRQQLQQQQLYQQQQQQIYNISGQIDGGDDAEGKEEYRLSVHGDGKKSSVNHDSGKEEYRLSQHGNGYQVPETPTPAAGKVLVAADVRATAESGVGATPPPLPILTKPKKSFQSMCG